LRHPLHRFGDDKLVANTIASALELSQPGNFF
jgi:hypothetical protein